MKDHIDAHLSGNLRGEVPPEWLRTNARTRCLVCGLSVSVQHGVHPTCRPAARAALGPEHTPAASAPPALPTMQEIHGGRTPTLRHVPAAARYLWNKTLTRALAAAAHHNDLRSWQELAMLPQTVLDAPRRGGRQHARAAAAYTKDRLQRWDAGERLSLWETRQQPLPRRARRRTDEERRELAVGLAREGFDGKACAALLAEGLCAETPATVAALQSLHPTQASPPPVAAHELPVAPELSPDDVLKALHTFPAATAPGPSGLRAQHLRDAFLPGAGEGLLQQLTAVVNLLAQGRACAAAAPALAGANLVAVPKPKGGVRPIAIGELLRRLTGKCLSAQVRAAAREHFFPAQVGVAVPAGAEAAVHMARAWFERCSGSSAKRALLKIDFENAFNTIDRQAVLSSAATSFPTLARWVHWCYGQPSDLHFGKSVLRSSSGVQQGDPLGPLLFAAALQPLAAELQRGGLDLAFFYLDDGVVAGDVAAVAAALAHVQQRGSDFGLSLNLDKCEVVCVGGTSAADLAVHLPDKLLRTSTGTSKVACDFELLGAPIGSPTFVAHHTASRVEKAATLLDAVGELTDPQVGLRLLRVSAGHARVLHSLRCVPPQFPGEPLQDFDQRVRACFGGLTGLHLDTTQWEQAARGFAQAGLGLRSAGADAPAAYLASLGGCVDLCVQLDPHYLDTRLADTSNVQAALQAYSARGGSFTADEALTRRQKALTSKLDDVSWARQLAAAPLTAQALLRSEAEPGARAFLVAVPHGATRMDPATFTCELRYRLGVPDALNDSWCPKCDAVLDTFSHHAGICAAGGERTLRHHSARDVLHTWAERAGLQPEKERSGLLLPDRPDGAGGRRRPADIFVPSYLGSPTAFDLAITGPQRQETLAEAGRKSLAAATSYAKVKMTHLNTFEECRAQGVRFTPMVAETTGAWEPMAAAVLQQLARAVAARENGDRNLLHSQLLQELSVTIRSWRARATLRRRTELVFTTRAVSAAAAAAANLDLLRGWFA